MTAVGAGPVPHAPGSHRPFSASAALWAVATCFSKKFGSSGNHRVTPRPSSSSGDVVAVEEHVSNRTAEGGQRRYPCLQNNLIASLEDFFQTFAGRVYLALGTTTDFALQLVRVQACNSNCRDLRLDPLASLKVSLVYDFHHRKRQLSGVRWFVRRELTEYGRCTAFSRLGRVGRFACVG